MRNIKYLVLIAVAVLMVAALAFSCAAPAPAPSPAPSPAPAPAPAPAAPIKVADIAALTGFMSWDDAESIQGLELKLEEVGYEVAGRKIELIKEDHACDPAKAVDKAKKVVLEDKVDVVLGPLYTPCWYAVADYLKASRTPNIGFMMAPLDILDFGDHVFLTQGDLIVEGYYLGAYAYDKMGYRTVTAFQPDVSHAEAWITGFIQAFEERGGSCVQRQRVPPDAMDFAANLTSMQKADCCVFWQHGPQCAPFINQYYEYGLNMPLFIPCTTPAVTAFRAFEGDQLENLGQKATGMLGSSAYTSRLDTAVNKKFVDAFYGRYHIYPSTLGASSYSATQIFLEAVKATGGDTSHDAIINAVRNIKTETPCGWYSFTPEGLGIGDVYITLFEKTEGRYDWTLVDTISQIPLKLSK
jgi:branched-chain amino acid transport system substrate-binding protein